MNTRRIIAALALALILVGCTICPPCPPCETPTPEPTATPKPLVTLWDSRLDRLHAYVDWDAQVGARYYPAYVWITEDGQWDNVPAWGRAFLTPEFGEAGGATHMFGRCLDVDGNLILNKSFRLYWPDGEVGGVPEASGWVNFFTNARYDPAETFGPYCLQALSGDPVCGGGQPFGGPHVSILVLWKARW